MNYYQNGFYPGYYNQQQYQMAAAPIQSQQGLQGKVVDSLEVVRASEVPFGGYGIFPKADLSEIYIKSWNSNGTTQVNVYKPISVDDLPKQEDFSETILKRVGELEQKIDILVGSISNKVDRKENKENVY